MNPENLTLTDPVGACIPWPKFRPQTLKPPVEPLKELLKEPLQGTLAGALNARPQPLTLIRP